MSSRAKSFDTKIQSAKNTKRRISSPFFELVSILEYCFLSEVFQSIQAEIHSEGHTHHTSPDQMFRLLTKGLNKLITCNLVF